MYYIKNENGKYLSGIFINHMGSLEFMFVGSDSSRNAYNADYANAIVFILNKYYGGNWQWELVVEQPPVAAEINNGR